VFINFFTLSITFIVATAIRKNAEDMEEVNFRGYTRLPTRKLCLAVRRSPCGEGNFLIIINKYFNYRYKYL